MANTYTRQENEDYIRKAVNERSNQLRAGTADLSNKSIFNRIINHPEYKGIVDTMRAYGADQETKRLNELQFYRDDSSYSPYQKDLLDTAIYDIQTQFGSTPDNNLFSGGTPMSDNPLGYTATLSKYGYVKPDKNVADTSIHEAAHLNAAKRGMNLTSSQHEKLATAAEASMRNKPGIFNVDYGDNTKFDSVQARQLARAIAEGADPKDLEITNDKSGLWNQFVASFSPLWARDYSPKSESVDAYWERHK